MFKLWHVGHRPSCNKMANTNADIKTPQAALLWEHNQYELNKKLQTEEETKAVGMSTQNKRKDLVWARASRVNLHG